MSVLGQPLSSLGQDPRTLTNAIDGAFVAPKQGIYLDDHSPATNAVLAKVPRSDASDVDAAVAAAHAAHDDGRWSGLSVQQRADVLHRVADLLQERSEELAQLESADTGKPISLARAVDVPRAVLNFRFFSGAVLHDVADAHHMTDALNYTVRKPLGVVAMITPWNLPIYLLSWKVAPALAMGNTVVAKPSELTPLTASALAEILLEAGLPSGVFNLVHGYGSEAGQPLVEHPDVSAVSFTGGTATGGLVASAAAPTFKKLSLELGGKNSTIVMDDADFDAAVAGTARAGFLNQGQVCLCGSRVLVQAPIYDRFVAALKEAAEAMVVGDPADEGSQLGALISHDHRAKVESYVALAKEEGGTILTGGTRPGGLPGHLADGAFLRPTVITGLDPGCRTATEEIFGPVVTVHPFADEQEAIAIANGVRYGLAASVWTTDLRRAHRVSAALHTGMVWVNSWLHRDLRVPFGGVKDSGIGREGGRHSLEFFSEAQNICIKLD